MPEIKSAVSGTLCFSVLRKPRPRSRAQELGGSSSYTGKARASFPTLPIHPLPRTSPAAMSDAGAVRSVFSCPVPPWCCPQAPARGDVPGNQEEVCWPFCSVLTKAGIIYRGSRYYTVSLFPKPTLKRRESQVTSPGALLNTGLGI